MKTCNEITVEDDWLANVSAHTDRPFGVENIDPTLAVRLISNIQDHSDLTLLQRNVYLQQHTVNAKDYKVLSLSCMLATAVGCDFSLYSA